jgi:hypothetical protein
MARSIATLIQKLLAGAWHPHRLRPAPGKLDRIARKYSVERERDFRDLYQLYDGGSVTLRSSIHLESVDGIAGLNEDEVFREDLAGMFLIGDDGGGWVYFYDPTDRLGMGAYALFMVSMGVLEYEHAIFVGRTLLEAVESVARGEDLHDRPKYGSGPKRRRG